MARRKVPREKIDKLWRAQAGRCFYCGGKMLKGRSPEERRQMHRQGVDSIATLDHLIPRADSGSGGLQNLVLACYRCNHERGTAPLTPDELRKAEEISKAARHGRVWDGVGG